MPFITKNQTAALIPTHRAVAIRVMAPSVRWLFQSKLCTAQVPSRFPGSSVNHPNPERKELAAE